MYTVKIRDENDRIVVEQIIEKYVCTVQSGMLNISGTLPREKTLRQKIEQIFQRNDQPYIHQHMINQIMEEIEK